MTPASPFAFVPIAGNSGKLQSKAETGSRRDRWGKGK